VSFFFNKGAFIWQKFPKFVLGFLLLASVNFFNKGQITNLGQSLALGLLLTFAGVGLNSFREMKKQGLRPFIVGAERS
jgi:uncharacterized membrane protein YadS